MEIFGCIVLFLFGVFVSFASTCALVAEAFLANRTNPIAVVMLTVGLTCMYYGVKLMPFTISFG